MSWEPPGATRPTDTATWSAGTDVLAAAPAEEPAKRASWWLVGGAAALVLALVAGVTYGVGALSGGGSQPEDALPAGAFGFAKVDLDPSAGQKIDGFRFLRKFPALRDKLGGGEDLRKLAFETVADGAGWSDVDFDAEVSSWMGKRIGVAAYPPEKTDDPFPDPTVVVALQVEGEAAAEDGLDRLADLEAGTGTPGTRLGFVVTGDYALLAETQELADRAARDAEAAVLADDANLASDLSALGDGVLAAWVDMNRATEAMGAAALRMSSMAGVFGGVGGAGGRSAYVARFDGPDVFEVAGRVIGADATGWASHSVTGMETLPESSVVAFGLADGDELVSRLYETLRTAYEKGGTEAGMPPFGDMVAQAEAQLGVEIPEDVAALLGDNLVGALDGGTSGTVQLGARVRTDVARAERVLDLLTAGDAGDFALARQRVGDELVVASTPGQAARLAAAGTLGDLPGFRDAMADLDTADLALWLDIAGLSETLFPSREGGAADENLAPIEGLGVTASSRDEGSGTFRVRLVAR